jgi:hypothetical protein
LGPYIHILKLGTNNNLKQKPVQTLNKIFFTILKGNHKGT